jgi:hypothetical protein
MAKRSHDGQLEFQVDVNRSFSSCTAYLIPPFSYFASNPSSPCIIIGSLELGVVEKVHGHGISGVWDFCLGKDGVGRLKSKRLVGCGMMRVGVS